MQASSTDRETSIFVLKWADIVTFCNVITSQLPELTLTAVCADRITRTFYSLEEFEAFSNPERAAILELSFDARSDDSVQRVTFVFNTDAQNNTRRKIEGQEALVTSLATFHEDFLAARRPWYSWYSRARWGLIVPGIFATGWIVVGILLYFKIQAAKSVMWEWPKEGIPARVFFLGAVVGLAPGFSELFLKFMRKKFFPTGVFAIGDGLSRHENKEVTRTVVIAGVAISILVTLIMSVFV